MCTCSSRGSRVTAAVEVTPKTCGFPERWGSQPPVLASCPAWLWRVVVVCTLHRHNQTHQPQTHLSCGRHEQQCWPHPQQAGDGVDQPNTATASINGGQHRQVTRHQQQPLCWLCLGVCLCVCRTENGKEKQQQKGSRGTKGWGTQSNSSTLHCGIVRTHADTPASWRP